MYTYERLCDDIAYLGFSGVDVGVFGKSAAGLSLFYIHAGDYSGKQIIVTGGIHARENVTSLLVARQAFYAAFCREEIEGGIYFLPMLNPDGAMLIEKGFDFLTQDFVCRDAKSTLKASENDGPKALLNKANVNENTAKRLQDILKSENLTNFSLWKANLNGVDLNNNFDAGFGVGARQKDDPSSSGYPGKFPFSERESDALRRFTLSLQPAFTLSYHALGREVYYSFGQTGDSLSRDKKIAEFAAAQLDYKLIDGDGGSTGGYKDWCISALRIPALTIEIISDRHSHPLCDGSLEEDYEANKNLPIKLLNFLNNL